MDDVTPALEAAAWAVVEGYASSDDLALLDAHPQARGLIFERLIDEAVVGLESARRLVGPEREQVVADFEDELDRLEAADELVNGVTHPLEELVVAGPVGEIRLQASWSKGQVVVWAAGPGATASSNDQLADHLEAIDGPKLGWSLHPDVTLPTGERAAALSIPVRWLGRTALTAVRVVVRGGIVPTLRTGKRPDGRSLEMAVRWQPARVDDADIAALAASMPGPVTALAAGEPRVLTLDILGAVVNAIATEAAGRLELPAPPPTTRTSAAVAEAVVTRLDGSSFEAPIPAGAEVSKRLERWAKPVVGAATVKLVVQLDPPDRSGAWFLSVLGPGAEGGLLPIEVALADSKDTRPVADELARLERVLPVVLRPGGTRRGQVYLSQNEAWELMTVTGPALEAAGFDVRVPALSRRKPTPGLRLFTEPSGQSVVGAHQLSNVSWSVLFDDVELTAAEVSRLAGEARPLVRSHGRWVELDRVDLKEAAAALAERASTTRMTGAEILRHAVGLDGSVLDGGVTVEGSGWATDLLDTARATSAEPVATPEGFVGELRSYQAEALGWLGFLDAVELGGCLALDMGLGKTPTVLAHLARTTGNGPALVIAPPAVVGNWAAEAARFTPGLRVVVHHGASRASADELEAEVAGADVIITTYGTAVRDVDALAARTWERVVLDEAQAIKNPANETAQQLRRIPARSRLALTGTPIENGLGDLWSILDFTNPGLVGSRATFVAQLSGEGEAALRALNGILVFRRTKKEPVVAAELPDRIDELDHCTMTREQIGLYQAVLDGLVADSAEVGGEPKKGAVLAAITALKQICNHPAAYQNDDRPLAGRSGKLARLEEIVRSVFAANERILVFTHFAEWGKKLADHLTEVTGVPIACYHGGLARGARDQLVADFQRGTGAGALVLSLKAGGTGLNLTAASHVVLYDRWWNPAVEDQARDRAWRIGQTRTVVSHRLVCPGTVDERVEEVVAGKRHIADLVLPKSSSLADLDADQLRIALGLRPDTLLSEENE
jgi:superfamily II DNA or RNA helicase